MSLERENFKRRLEVLELHLKSIPIVNGES